MKKNQFSPTVDGASLESRLVPAVSTVQTALITPVGAPTDPDIPFVIAPPGVPQSSINFTTLRASQILHGSHTRSGYQPGIYKAFQIASKRGDLRLLNSYLDQLAGQIPYGRVELLPQWQLSLARLAVSPRNVTNQVRQEVLQDYVDYLKANIGITFNYLQSRRGSNEFAIPTNGKV